ncbi:glycosyltransferase, partial [Chitinophagaceae bacterium LB-8]
MLCPIKVIDVELSAPIESITGLDKYLGLQGLVRLHGTPIGYINVPVTGGQVDASIISKEILEKHHTAIINRLLQNGLLSSESPKDLRIEDLFNVKPPEPTGIMPFVTVAVCTRNRTTDLALCLDALCGLDYPHLEILVVDNAPSTNDTALLVKNHYPSVRYICEPRPGLSWARNRAVLEAEGEIIAFTDDDVIVDAGWVKALASVFAESPEVMAVTGLVVPYELETQAQVLFEMYGGFGKGFQRKSWSLPGEKDKRAATLFGCAGQFGTGANMALHRRLFDQIGLFDPALDVGTVTNGGGDIEMFFRVLKEGYELVYEPRALVRHRHRREISKLYTQITNNGVGLYAFWVRSAKGYPEERWAFIRLGLWWLRWWHLRRLFNSYLIPTQFPRDLITAELKGFFSGMNRYQKACRIANQMMLPDEKLKFTNPVLKQAEIELKENVAIRTVEINQPLKPIVDIKGYLEVQVFVHFNSCLIGSINFLNKNDHISQYELADAITRHFSVSILKVGRNINNESAWNHALHAIKNHYLIKKQPGSSIPGLSPEVKVSIVVATYDRPEDLSQCLR